MSQGIAGSKHDGVAVRLECAASESSGVQLIFAVYQVGRLVEVAYFAKGMF